MKVREREIEKREREGDREAMARNYLYLLHTYVYKQKKPNLCNLYLCTIRICIQNIVNFSYFCKKKLLLQWKTVLKKVFESLRTQVQTFITTATRGRSDQRESTIAPAARVGTQTLQTFFCPSADFFSCHFYAELWYGIPQINSSWNMWIN